MIVLHWLNSLDIRLVFKISLFVQHAQPRIVSFPEASRAVERPPEDQARSHRMGNVRKFGRSPPHIGFEFGLPNNNPLARLAQSVERETLNLKVAGSTPALGSIPDASQVHWE
ncbi:hypothetical protein HD806DRAFT_455925 [Xylariaceae sp. AK1471]|nr:hypothetical protein HD806DRAFT_455925 [Xylariaceae sp. AK1471]